MNSKSVRRSDIERKTFEVEINGKLNLDGSGKIKISTSIPFFDHFISTLAKHAHFDLELKASGDLEHHLIEDVGIALGSAVNNALGKRRGIKRFGSALIPMDESLSSAAVDLSGRGYAHINLGIVTQEVEGMKLEDLEHFLRSFALSSKSTIHINLIYGDNEHHKIESAIKALAYALRNAIIRNGRIEIPSVKGEL